MPRLSIQLTEDQADTLDKFCPWGTKQAIYSALTDMLIEAYQTVGSPLTGILVAKDFNLITKAVKMQED